MGSGLSQTPTAERPSRVGHFKRRLPVFTIGDVALGNNTLLTIATATTNGYLFIGIIGLGCYGFSSYAHAGYVADKLGLYSFSDALHVADFINDQLGVSAARQGSYSNLRLLE